MTAIPDHADDWHKNTPEGRLSWELSAAINDVARWRSFMSNGKALSAVFELLVAANELLPIVHLREGEEIDEVRYVVSAASHAGQAAVHINSIGVD